MMRRRLARVRGDSGAAALEFGLVVPVLLLLAFGIIDYGMFFTDSLGARDGVRQAARQGVVDDIPAACPSGTKVAGEDNELARLACIAVDETGSIGGTAYARSSSIRARSRGDDLLVCVAVTGEGVTGYVPMPNAHTVRARLHMRVEQPATDPGNSGEGSGSDPVFGVAQEDGAPAPPFDLWAGWCA
jgi:hypothetical protein